MPRTSYEHMRIATVRLKNFKRFTDLRISAIPESARLVVVVGPNGCGKSSLFDAFIQWYRGHARFGYENDESYYRKDPAAEFAWGRSVEVGLHCGAEPQRGCLYVRTAYRNDADFAVANFVRPDVPSEVVRIARAIDNDQTVGKNYQRLVYDTMAGVYDLANDSKPVRQLREELIGELRSSMLRVFGDLSLNSISDPLGAGAFFFEKGVAKAYHYKNLSGGEKAAFDLLLDLHVKKRFFGDAIYCVDEVETHLHTRVQGAVVKEMVEILPQGSQLWITTHSLGVLRAAQAMEHAEPGSVAIIDFEGVDPDVPHELTPSSLDRVSWDKFLALTLDDLAGQVAPNILVVCEGSAIGNRRKDFDADIYNRVLGAHAPGILFVSGGSSSQVMASGVSIREALKVVLPGAKVVTLVDRDAQTPSEVTERESGGDIVLARRNLESYLLADDVIEALVRSLGKDDLLDDALQMKRDAIAASAARRNAPDDLKSAASEIYTELRRLLELERPGNTTDAFMRFTLAPLIEPSMQTYQALRREIIERLV